MRDRFFGHLAASGDIDASAATIGLTAAQVRQPLRLNPAFAAQWEGAIRAGYLMLEIRLIGSLLAGKRPAEAREGPPALDGGDWDRALKLLAHDKSRRPVRVRAKAEAAADAVAGRDETDKVILDRLAALAGGRAKGSTTIDGEGA